MVAAVQGACAAAAAAGAGLSCCPLSGLRRRRCRACSHLAASEGCYQVTEWLISQGCNINALDRFNRTPVGLKVYFLKPLPKSLYQFHHNGF